MSFPLPSAVVIVSITTTKDRRSGSNVGRGDDNKLQALKAYRHAKGLYFKYGGAIVIVALLYPLL